jgi:hypothetical protein
MYIEGDSRLYPIIHTELLKKTTILKIDSNSANTFQVQAYIVAATSICSVNGKEVTVYGSERRVLEIKRLRAIVSLSKIYANRSISSLPFKYRDSGNMSHLNKSSSIVIKEPYSSENRVKCSFSVTVTPVKYFCHDLPLSGSVQDHSSGLIILFIE